ncbi:sensor domain-containing protein, partial [Mycolicibacter sinensis]|uniref:sensor domain-containing protein n=1 Tax=Mycolicibacter sinensis (strain JDM601) TaxID=875328 RepID=UPI001F2C5E0F
MPDHRDPVALAPLLGELLEQRVGVQDVAHEFWDSTSAAGDSSLTGVGEAVIALASAADADALFEKFSQQWGQCDGVTVIRHG